MRKKRDLYFLRKIAEKTCDCSLIIDIGGQKFGISAIADGVQVVHISSQDCTATNTLSILESFLGDHVGDEPMLTDEKLYLQIIEETMKVAISDSIGISRKDMEILIGSMAEFQPEDVETYLKLLKRI